MTGGNRAGILDLDFDFKIRELSSSYSIKCFRIDRVSKREVEQLALDAIRPLLNRHSNHFSHLITATSCPDSIAPSLGQCIIERLHKDFGNLPCFDLVQGCAGGVSAMILASQLAEQNRSSVMLVSADAARKATSQSSDLHSFFSNGSFACVISYSDSPKGLLKYRSRQFENLSGVVTIRLGHDSDEIIQSFPEVMAQDPRKHLGLIMNNRMAIQLMKEAEKFYVDFTEVDDVPDILLLHHVNPHIISHLQNVFSRYPVEFINHSDEVRNCGASTTGVVLYRIFDKIKDKKVMICSFGTGGVITAGLWKF